MAEGESETGHPWLSLAPGRTRSCVDRLEIACRTGAGTSQNSTGVSVQVAARIPWS